ncbi:MAG: hypothetical protein D6732_05565 [Methanobacteriota archaeon]|nr:MAG: hypothetical protein D6732_05565 [Euryarchaeota archaeon]
MIAWVGFKRKKIFFDVPSRVLGQSKWSFVKLLGLAIRAVTSFSAAPLRLVSLIGFLFLLFSVIMAMNTLYQYFSGKAITGFTTVILLILISSSIIMLALGIIGEYIARIYEEVKSRPRYIIRDRIS